MSVNLSKVSLVVCGGVLTVIVSARPEWLSDANSFLKGFINHEYLNVLGVILAITLASLAQLHLGLNRIEERAGFEFLKETRDDIKSSAFWLIGLFISGFVITLVKPLICQTDTSSAIANSVAIFILLFYVLILIDITMAVFDLRADFDGNGSSDGDQKGQD